MTFKQPLLLGILLASVGAGSAMAEGRYFVEGMVGQADHENKLAGFDTIDGKAKSRGIRTGFYLGDHWAVELGRQKYGEADESFTDEFGERFTDTLKTDSYTFGLRGAIHLAPAVLLTGRIGWAAWDFRLTEFYDATPADVFVDDDEGIDVYTGIGLQFEPEPNFHIAVEYTTLEFRAAIDGEGTNQNIRNFAVTAGFSF